VTTPNPAVSILVVDDEPAVTAIVQRYVRKMGYESVTATDLASAAAAAERQHFTLLIIDLHLACERGTDVVKQLRERGLDCPVLFISGDASVDAVDESMQEGIFFVPKPFTMAELSDGIWTVLRQR